MHPAQPLHQQPRRHVCTAKLPTIIVDFEGYDSSIILILRGGIPRPIGDFPESLSQAMLAGCNVNREIGRMYVTVWPGPVWYVIVWSGLVWYSAVWPGMYTWLVSNGAHFYNCTQC